MSYNIPGNLRYAKTHEWVMDMGENKYRIGVSDYAAKHIGDVTYVELPEIESEMDRSDTECVIETVKSSEDVYNHIAGSISVLNEDILNDNPELVNGDCYGDGWLYEVKAESDSDFNDLMSAEDYKKFLDDLHDD